MTQFNNTLTQAFDAYRTNHANGFTMNKIAVNREHLEVAHNMMESFRSEIEESWNAEDDVDSNVEKLDRAATNTYNEFCRKAQGKPVKQRYLTEEIVEDVYECNRKWQEVKRLGSCTQIHGWEKILKTIHQQTETITETSQQPTKEIGQIQGALFDRLLEKYRDWHKHKKAVRIRVNKARVDFHTKIVNDTKGGSVSNVWTAINTISPRKFASRSTMQKTTGEWCHEPEEALEEIGQFAKEELKQVDVEDFEKPAPAGPIELDEDNEPTPMDVISGFRRTNPNKSGTGWSVPNKLWLILENEISYKFADVWT